MRGQPIKIFGKTGAARDYIYVRDLAVGIVSILEKGHLSEIYNMGSRMGLSNMDAIEAMRSLMKKNGFEVIVEHLPECSFDVKANVLDSTKLKEHTVWKPRIGIGEGLRHNYKWLKDCRG